jgi:predicted amidophosphoribosyltransferase
VWQAIRPWLFPIWCVGCGEHEVALCDACAALAVPFDLTLSGITIRAAGDYGGTLRDAILRLKRGERAYLDPLARLIAPLVPDGTSIVPIRTTRGRAAERGFDQAVELARRVADLRGGWVDDVIRKTGAAQRGQSRDARYEASGRFRIRPEADVPTRAVVLDDVFTTGATLRDAIATLTAAGCWVSGGAVVARTPPGRAKPEAGSGAETPRRTRRLVTA